MRHLITVLILALASTNASKHYRPERQFEQEPREVPYLAIALNEEQFVPLVEEAARWDSPLDPRVEIFDDLDSLENFLQEDQNDFRVKRTKTSLSIDNPLDVLRQQFYKAFARRMINKSIEQNRQYLLKTGKRSGKEISSLKDLAKQSDFQSRKDFKENESAESENQSNGQNPTTRQYQNRLEELSFQT